MSDGALTYAKATWRVIAGGIVALACAVFASSAMATLYKWTDAGGRIVYSDQPPIGIKYETISGAAPPSSPDAVKDMAVKDMEMRKRRTEAAEKEKKAETQRVDVAKRAEECKRNTLQVKQLAAEQIPFVRYNEKNELVYVDDATRRKERAELEVWIRQNCQT